MGRENIREKEPKRDQERPGPYSHGERKKKGNPRKIEGIIISFISLFIPVARFTKVGELGNVNYISSHLVSLVQASRTRRLNPSSLRISNRIRGLCPHNQLRSQRGRGEPRRQIQFVWLTNHVKTPLATPSHFPEKERNKQRQQIHFLPALNKLSQQRNTTAAGLHARTGHSTIKSLRIPLRQRSDPQYPIIPFSLTQQTCDANGANVVYHPFGFAQSLTRQSRHHRQRVI